MLKTEKNAFSPGKRSGERLLFGRLAAPLGIAALIIWSAAMGIVSLWFAAEASAYHGTLFASYFSQPLIILLNILPVLLLAALVFFISNRVWIAVGASGALTLLLSLINYYKLLLRDDPFLAMDIKYMAEAAQISSRYEFVMIPAVPLAAAGVVVCAVMCALLLKMRFKKRRFALRGALAAAAALLSVVLAVTVFTSEETYNKTANTGGVNAEFMSMWSDTDQYMSRGFLYPFLNSLGGSGDKKPDGYSKSGAEALLSNYEGADIAEDKRISVIAVMLEAYNDFSKFDGVKLENDPYEFFHELQAEGVSGTLVTNIFAGGTTDTERCFITGYPALYQYRAATPSWASYFAAQGYTAEGAHPGYDWFYNRRNVNEYFGFQNYYFFEDRYNETGWIIEDGVFFQDLITLYNENLETGRPYFNFSVTYQNHGPYAADARESDVDFISGEGISAEADTILNNYLYGISKTDAAMRELTEYFRGVTEPVVLVFFGDHNPWMGDGAFVFRELGVNLSRDTDDGFLNYYETPYVIWANDAAKAVSGNDFSGDGGSFSPMFLMSEIFDLCSWEGDEYMQVVRELRKSLDVVHETGMVRENGVMTENPSDAASSALSDFMKIQYYWRRGK